MCAVSADTIEVSSLRVIIEFMGHKSVGFVIFCAADETESLFTPVVVCVESIF